MNVGGHLVNPYGVTLSGSTSLARFARCVCSGVIRLPRRVFQCLATRVTHIARVLIERSTTNVSKLPNRIRDTADKQSATAMVRLGASSVMVCALITNGSQ